MARRLALARRAWLLAALSVVVSLAVVGGLWLSFGSGGGAAHTVATVGESRPLSLIVVSNGAHDSLLLEWSGGPADATGWQYRQRHWTREGQIFSWTAWTDIPGGTNIRSYRVSGLSERSSYEYQLRAVVGTTPGAESEPPGRGGTQAQGAEVYDIYLSRVVEGDGRSRWQVVDFTIVIPDGVRLKAHGSVIASDSGNLTPVYVADGSGGVAFDRTGRVYSRYPEAASPTSGAATAISGASTSDAATLIDQIVKSVQKYP